MAAPLPHTIFCHRTAGCPSLFPHTSSCSLIRASGCFTIWLVQMMPVVTVATAHMVSWSSNILILFFHHTTAVTSANICLPYQCCTIRFEKPQDLCCRPCFIRKHRPSYRSVELTVQSSVHTWTSKWSRSVFKGTQQRRSPWFCQLFTYKEWECDYCSTTLHNSSVIWGNSLFP